METEVFKFLIQEKNIEKRKSVLQVMFLLYLV